MSDSASTNFKVLGVLQTGIRSVVIAEYPSDEPFEFESGDLLNDKPVREIDIPRKIDSEGNQMRNCWAFTLDNELDSSYFKEGDIVELTSISSSMYNQAQKKDANNKSGAS